MRALRILLALLAVLLVVMAVVMWTLPASLAWRMAGSRLPVLQLQGIDGTVWHGSAAAASVAGQPLGRLAWDLAPAPLLKGEVRANVNIDGPLLQAQGMVSRLPDGRIDIRDAHAQSAAEPLRQALGLGALRPLGTLTADVREASIRNAWFETLDAVTDWREAGFAGAAQVHFGDIHTDFMLDDQHRVLGDILDNGNGPLDVQGEFQAEPAGYLLNVRLAARHADDWQTQEALQQLGQRQPDGSVLLRVEGRLLGNPWR